VPDLILSGDWSLKKLMFLELFPSENRDGSCIKFDALQYSKFKNLIYSVLSSTLSILGKLKYGELLSFFVYYL
jgi:hypothetical protein